MRGAEDRDQEFTRFSGGDSEHVRIVAQSPDSFLSDLIRENAEGVAAAFRAMRKRFKKPPMSVNDFFASLEKHGLDLTAKQLAHLRDLL